MSTLPVLWGWASILLSIGASAATWDDVLSERSPAESLYTHGYSGVLMGKQNDTEHEHFDLWIINSGYQLPLSESWHWFIEAGSTASSSGQEAQGYTLGSGVRYQLMPSLSLGSQVRQLHRASAHTQLQFNGVYKLPSSLSLQADIGVSTEQSLSLGLGFQF